MSIASSDMILAVRSIFAIICITILSIIAITEGLNGDIMKWAIAIIGLLGGAEVLAEYIVKRNKVV
jgi:hypothetical protein